MKAATIALVLKGEGETLTLVETLSDDREIALYQYSLEQGVSDPLQAVHEQRTRNQTEDEEFGDYVEDLLSQPFLRAEIREHGLQWLKSKMKIEGYKRSEVEAARTIAEFAFKMVRENRKLADFSLAGTSTMIRVKVFLVTNVSDSQQKAA